MFLWLSTLGLLMDVCTLVHFPFSLFVCVFISLFVCVFISLFILSSLLAGRTLYGSLSVDNIMDHLSEFNGFANASSNSRSVVNGYNASANYVMEKVV